MRGDYMISAVTRALTGRFRDHPPVHTERPAQNVAGEYIFVHQINREQQPDTFRRYNRFYFFDIRFHPDDKRGSQYRRTAEIIEELTECLRLVATDDLPVRASSMRSEVRDGVLHFFVDYPVRVLVEAPEEPKMEQLDIDEKLKE